MHKCINTYVYRNTHTYIRTLLSRRQYRQQQKGEKACTQIQKAMKRIEGEMQEGMSVLKCPWKVGVCTHDFGARSRQGTVYVLREEWSIDHRTFHFHSLLRGPQGPAQLKDSKHAEHPHHTQEKQGRVVPGYSDQNDWHDRQGVQDAPGAPISQPLIGYGEKVECI